MVPPTPETAAEASVFSQVLANFLGGIAVTVLWFFVTALRDRREMKRQRRQKRESLVLEIARIRGALRVLREDPDVASAPWPARTSSALAAIARLGPPVSSDTSFEPALAELEYRLQQVDVLASHYYAAVSGIAAALQNNEEHVRSLQGRLDQYIKDAVDYLRRFERLVVSS